MFSKHVGGTVSLLALFFATGVSIQPAFALSRYQLTLPSGTPMSVSQVNQKREDNSMVLYTPDYGASTRTNPFGVEVSAEPITQGSDTYRVDAIRSVFDCQHEQTMSQCGNMAIPKGGVVLSASGTARQELITQFHPGDQFQLSPLLIYESSEHLNATNPTALTNPAGAGFPGFRGGNQLVLYNNQYSDPTTGTNEFGFEVTVEDGRVVAAEGTNSKIPRDMDAFVLSGHGQARQWLIDNAPIGSKIDVRGDTVVSTVDKDTYIYQLDQMTSKINSMNPKAIPIALLHRMQTVKDGAFNLTNTMAAKEILQMEQDLTPILWSSYPRVGVESTRAVWHRPSERSLAEIQQSLNLLQKAGFNTIYLETYLHGTPIFYSKTLTQYNIPQKLPFDYAQGNQDLLQVWLDEAHKRGMKVHVWFQTFYAGNLQYDKTKGEILTAHPDWANIQRSALDKPELPPSTLEPGAYFLDPANPEVQTFLLSLMNEIVSKYNIDGFQLDYIRYPASFPKDRLAYVATTWGYTQTARQTFQAKTGVDPIQLTPDGNPELWAAWNQYKVQQVNAFVEKAHALIKAKHPTLLLSAAVFPDLKTSIERKEQDWLVWGQNHWVDFFAPMTLTSALDIIATDTKEVKTESALPVVTGIFGPFNGNRPTDVLDQVLTAYQSGANGVAVFDTAHLTQKMAEALHMGLFKPVATNR